MLEAARTAIDAIPGGVVAFLAPLALWANAIWASPFLKTKRHGLSGLIALAAGLLMFTAVEVDSAHFIVPFVFASLAMLAMLLIMLWPKPFTQKRSRRPKRRKKVR